MTMSWFWKRLGRLVERVEQALLALEDARLAAEQVVLQPALDAGELEDRREVRRQVAAQHAQAAGRLVGLRDGVDDLAVGLLRAEALDLRGQRLAGAGQHVAVEQAGVEQLAHDHLHAADLVDVDHRVLAVGPRVGEHRDDMLREVVELLRRDDLLPEVAEAGGARDLRRVQGHVGRAADRHRHDHRVAQRIAHDDVARLEVLLDQVGEMVDQLGRRTRSTRRGSSDGGATMCSGCMPTTPMKVCMVL